MTNAYRAARKASLWAQQGGRCFWCNCVMSSLVGPPQGFVAWDVATLDHLDERTHYVRAVPEKCGGSRTVLACRACNEARSTKAARRERNAEQAITVAGQH